MGRVHIGLALLILAPALAKDLQLQGPLPARDGETCAVCGGRLTSRDRAYLADGQRFAVMEGMERQFLDDPMRYVGRFRPENMMFSGRSRRSISSAYLYAGVMVLLGLLLGGLWAHFALLKHRPAWAAVRPSALGKIPRTRDAVACTHCGAPNHPAATGCSHCGGEMDPTAPSEASAVRTG